MEQTTVKISEMKGAFVGLALGDALGAPVEFRDRGSFAPVTDMQAGGTFKLPAGAWTDDTAQALCLADSLLLHPMLDPADLLHRFCDWAEHGHNSATGVSVGIGQNTLRALGNHKRKGDLRAGSWSKSDGNGSLMRLAPVAMLHRHDIDNAMQVARGQSATTHGSRLCAEACSFLTRILIQLFDGTDWNKLDLTVRYGELAEFFGSDAWRSKPEDGIRSTGYVVDTLEAALWCVDQTDSFEAALIKAVNLGGDADTVGAVAGQIAGARYGYEAIPARWLSAVMHREKIEQTASALIQAGTMQKVVASDLVEEMRAPLVGHSQFSPEAFEHDAPRIVCEFFFREWTASEGRSSGPPRNWAQNPRTDWEEELTAFELAHARAYTMQRLSELWGLQSQ